MSKVLLVTVTNPKYPVTADVVQTVFCKHGDVQKVVCFPRQLGEQVLIEMRSVEQAKAAKRELDGQSLYGAP